MTTKKEESLLLAEELLSDIELNRIEPMDIARKASRLARITDDTQAIEWLSFEVFGYPEGVKGLAPNAWMAAIKSNRVYEQNGAQYARTNSIGFMYASVEANKIQLSAASDAPCQISSSNPYQHVFAPTGNHIERDNLRKEMINSRSNLDKVIGSIHTYVTSKYQELRFGAAVENAFQIIRSNVDSLINDTVPNAIPILTTALENASDDNSIQCANAAKACRDLLIATADALRPPGEPKNGHEMKSTDYVNRLVDWIDTHSTSSTTSKMYKSDLEDLGNRLDAITDSGNKGAHVIQIPKTEASRYVVGTYILLGDILNLKASIPIATNIPTISPALVNNDESVEEPKSTTKLVLNAKKQKSRK